MRRKNDRIVVPDEIRNLIAAADTRRARLTEIAKDPAMELDPRTPEDRAAIDRIVAKFDAARRDYDTAAEEVYRTLRILLEIQDEEDREARRA